MTGSNNGNLAETYEVTVKVHVSQPSTTNTKGMTIDQKLTEQKAENLISVIKLSAQDQNRSVTFTSRRFEQKDGTILTLEVEWLRGASIPFKTHEPFIRSCANALPRSTREQLTIHVSRR